MRPKQTIVRHHSMNTVYHNEKLYKISQNNKTNVEIIDILTFLILFEKFNFRLEFYKSLLWGVLLTFLTHVNKIW